MAHKILIASSAFDEPNTLPVVEQLEREGFTVILYQSDQVFNGTADFTGMVTEHEAQVCYNNLVIKPGDIAAAWFRRPNHIGSSLKDMARLHSLRREATSLQELLWSFVPEEKWLNAPSRIKAADFKLPQLRLAQEIGFCIPKTVATNNWQTIKTELPDELIIMKMQTGVLATRTEAKGMGTTALTKKRVEQLSEAGARPFPGIFQPFISKKREWRVTIVGDAVFSVAIYTESEAQLDWREHQTTDKVRFKAEKLAPDIEDKCLLFLKRCSLRFGAFDLIESSDGTITFLELNPNGQYMWLERDLNLPISKAIATELASIAQGPGHDDR